MKMREAGRSSDPMRPETSLALKKAAIERELGRLLPRRGPAVARAMRFAVIPGGKRFRPLLVLASGACFGARRSVLLPFACALELIHSYSLVHDDLPAMDNDDFRRGRPSCHKAFGEGVALLAGDGLLTLAFESMAAARVPARLRAAKEAAMEAVGRRAGVEGMIGGQVVDLESEGKPINAQVLEYIHRSKTGALLTTCTRCGALAAGATAAQLHMLTDYGRKIGLAFQIVDDILDITVTARTVCGLPLASLNVT